MLLKDKTHMFSYVAGYHVLRNGALFVTMFLEMEHCLSLKKGNMFVRQYY